MLKIKINKKKTDRDATAFRKSYILVEEHSEEHLLSVRPKFLCNVHSILGPSTYLTPKLY